MFGKLAANVTANDLYQLSDNGVRESRTLEFKEEYGRIEGGSRRINDEQKKELLADVSAFANSAGGDLVIGIREEVGKAAQVVGLDVADVDAELLKLESIVRHGVEPRIPGVTFQFIEVSDGRRALVISVPRSWLAPHRVIANNKFWARNSAGKYEMSVSELRESFTLADTLINRIRQFRSERLGMIVADEVMVPLKEGPKLILHIIPLSAFQSATQILFGHQDIGIPPLSAGSGWNPRYTLEGLGTYSGSEGAKDGCRSYTLLFRTGIIEAVNQIGGVGDDGSYIYPSDIEEALVSDLPQFMLRLHKESIEGPFYLYLSLVGVRGYELFTGRMGRFFDSGRKLRQDSLLLPELMLPTTEVEAPQVRPLCDMIFNAFGFARSPSFNPDGTYGYK